MKARDSDKKERITAPADEVSVLSAMQPYTVTMAKHQLSAIELRIMSLVLLKLKNEQYADLDAKKNGDVRDVSDLFDSYKQVRIKSANAVVCDNHKQVKSALSRLRKRDIETSSVIDGKKGVWIDGLISRGFYSEDGGEIIIEMSPSLFPRLIEVSNGYTEFGLKFMFSTKSAHAIRWYQIASNWLKKGVFSLSKDDIIELFKIQGKYNDAKNFRRYILKNPLDEINKSEHSNIHIKIIKTHKKGRNVVGYTFSVTEKEKTKAIEPQKEMPELLVQYIVKHWQAIEHWSLKCNLDSAKIKEKLNQRGVPADVTNQRHFDNMTNKYLATILVKDGVTNLTVEQMLREIKN